MKIAVVGSGISGLSCAYRLSESGFDVTLFEADKYFGGHSHTVDVTLGGVTHGVDTGFLVFNHKTYPNLVKLFDSLKVETVATDMSFSVKMPIRTAWGTRNLEWAGENLNTVFMQRRNVLNPKFLKMVQDILRFNRQATAMAAAPASTESEKPLGEFLTQHRYSRSFRDWYLLPMAGCIWSCPTEQMLAFPVSTFVRFCHNHGLLQVNDRPQWQTVKGGSRNYVEKMIARTPNTRIQTPVHSITRTLKGGKQMSELAASNGKHVFDHVVLASHTDQTARMLRDARPDEQDVLKAVAYQRNRAVLHTDASCLPENRKAWSAWNYQSSAERESQVCVHYLINKLQPLPFDQPVIVSLNPISEPDPTTIIDTFDYSHPVFDARAIAAQSRLAAMQGVQNTWFAGAWTGYGFHEDGLKSGLAVADAIIKAQRQSLAPARDLVAA
ncbi:MAG: NAD(P)/FAD-dependent oxidoreductase [Burkholderiaceae bacterium]